MKLDKGHNDPVTIEKAEGLLEWQSDENIYRLYERYKDNPQIKWKSSIQKIISCKSGTSDK